jgi:hypothetical protein
MLSGHGPLREQSLFISTGHVLWVTGKSAVMKSCGSDAMQYGKSMLKFQSKAGLLIPYLGSKSKPSK